MGYQKLSTAHIRGLDVTINDIKDTLTDLLLLSDPDRDTTHSVYLMTYEEYSMLSSKL
jgi:hypothetical protein